MRSRWAIRTAVVFIVILGVGVGYLGPRRVLRAGIQRLNRFRLVITGRLVDIGGYRLHVERRGTGQPTIILETGLGQPLDSWRQIPVELAKLTRVVTYDRAFLGHSDPGPLPRTYQKSVDELHTLLTRIEEPGPYVMVGHSNGGINVRLFASQHPDDVVGIVLIEASHEEQILRYANILPTKAKQNYLDVGRGKNPEQIDSIASAAQIRISDPLPDIPLTVIFQQHMRWPVNWPVEELEKERYLMQQELVNLTPKGITILAENSGHFIHWNNPELVIEAIRKVVEEVRLSQNNTSCSEDSSH